ncbi:MAG: TonB-dependent receptor [Bacteroidales bacterium]|nr:TonB-dependent receptor [Bacteroidales bacterium]MBN2818294.1 TonB-dependent receptor [Bacteroidales bacterium]
MRKHFISLIIALMTISAVSFAQVSVVTGTVTADDGTALPGAAVQIKGTSIGVTTDLDGNYTISVAGYDNPVLTYTYVGYLTEEVEVGNQSEISIVLIPDLLSVDEVVVIGYGVQKKKLNTGATLNMKGDELQKLNNADAMASLQGISPGVSITNESGKPGAGTKVTIRGIGTIGNAKPLYVVDGVQVANIDYLNPSDIESIDILKDAASSAIYGSQAANGVILVTTRSGKKGQGAVISYDNYFGVQQVAKDPGMLNAQDYITAINEGRKNRNKGPMDFSSVPRYNEIMAGTYNGQDWFNEQVNDNAGVQSHAINVTGSSDKSIYALGFSSLQNEGLLGKQGKPDYQRITARMNSQHILKEWNGLDGLVFGENLTYTNTENPNVGTGNIYDNNVRDHSVASPLLPLYDSAGNYTTVSSVDNFATNPTARLEYNKKYNENNNNNLVGNVYLEIQPIKSLRIRSSYGITNSTGTYRNYVPTYYQTDQSLNDNDDVQQGSYNRFTWIFTNTISYNFSVKEQHNFNLVVGQEAQQTKRDLQLQANNKETLFQDWEYAYLTNTPLTSLEYITMTGRDDFGWAMSSYFGRLSYNFEERYMLTAVYRRDGSTNFGPANRYATFPSLSAGWILSQEDFMSALPQISYLRLRGSWGQNGNQNIGAFQYLAGVEYVGANYPFGPDYTNNTVGSQLANLPNPKVKWETSEQLNIGLDFNLFENKLLTTFDWYNKETKDWLLIAPVLLTAGAPAPYSNGGSVSNKGIEASFKWVNSIGEFKYSITATLGMNKNEVTEISNEEGIIHGDINSLWQGVPESYRAEVGYPIGYFWGYTTNGIIRSDADSAAYVDGLIRNSEQYATANGEDTVYARLTNVAKGEIMFQDLNEDGLINDLDKTQIGDPNPDFTFGLQLFIEYKNIDFQVVGVGKSGHQILMSYSSAGDRLQENMTYDYFNKAYDETRNPGGTMPRITSAPNSRTEISDMHIYDADYFRISTITLGYNFRDLIKTKVFSDLRLFASGQNLFTFTKYPGMSPEVGWGNGQSWASGIDVGLYPLAKTYMMGLSVKF